MKIVPDIAATRINYNPKTGAFVWEYDNKMHPRLNGKEAGTIRDGYLAIKINGVSFKAHRIAWFIVTGNQPKTIDHINGNGLDNRFCNLRNTSQMRNTQNHGRITNNSGLPCGVRVTKKGRYQARVTCNKIVYHLGTFETISDAEIAYLSRRKELFGEYSRGGE